MKKYIVKVKLVVRKKLAKMNALLRIRFAKYIDSLENFDLVVWELDIKKLKWFENRYRLSI